MSSPRGANLLPALVLAAIVAIGALGWWLFPVLQDWAAGQGCIASGHTNCG